MCIRDKQRVLEVHIEGVKTRQELKLFQSHNLHCYSRERAKRKEQETLQRQQHFLYTQFVCHPGIILHASIYHPNLIPWSYTPPAQFLINTTTPHRLLSQHLRPLPLSYQIMPPPSHWVLRISQHLGLSITQFLPHHAQISANIPKYILISSARWQYPYWLNWKTRRSKPVSKNFVTDKLHHDTWNCYLMWGFVLAHLPSNTRSNLELRWSCNAFRSELMLLSASTLRNICQREYSLRVDASKKQLPSRNDVSLALDGWTSTN